MLGEEDEQVLEELDHPQQAEGSDDRADELGADGDADQSSTAALSSTDSSSTVSVSVWTPTGGGGRGELSLVCANTDTWLRPRQLASAVCLLRGRVYEALENRKKAVFWYSEAVKRDVKCYEVQFPSFLPLCSSPWGMHVEQSELLTCAFLLLAGL